MRSDTVAKALLWSLCSEEMYGPSVIPPAVSQQQYFRGGADAQSLSGLSGYISIELLLESDVSFEALHAPCINVSRGKIHSGCRTVPEPSQGSNPSCLALLLFQILHSLSSVAAGCVPCCTTNHQLEHTDELPGKKMILLNSLSAIQLIFNT